MTGTLGGTTWGHRLFFTLFLVTTGLGYLASVSNIVLTTSASGLQGLDKDAVVVKFHGSLKMAKLIVKINTTMREYLETEEEKVTIENWVLAGAGEEAYTETIAPLMEQRCLKCHDVFGEQEKHPLTTYKEVKAYTKPSTGKSIQELTQLSHQHLFGMGFIFFLTGLVLLRTDRWLAWKSVLVCMGFCGVIGDIAGWWLTKWSGDFAPVIMASGGIHALAFAGILLTAMFEMWLARPRG